MVTIIGSVPSGIYEGQVDFELIGTDFLTSGAIVELGDNSVYSSATRITLAVKSQTDTSIVVDITTVGLPSQSVYYFFVTNSLSQLNDPGYEVSFYDDIVIYSVNPSAIYEGLTSVLISGAFFGSSGATVELCDSDDYGTATVFVPQTVLYQDETRLVIEVTVSSLTSFNYIHVTNPSVHRAHALVLVYTPDLYIEDPFILSFTTGLSSESVTRIFGGYGQDAVGRHQYGAPTSLIEPRYDVSLPEDEEINVSRNQWITFSTYYYSSICDFDVGIYIEISEDNGINYVEAASPDYEIIKRVKDGQRFWFKIRKSVGKWPANTWIVIRYTGPDEHGNVSTKVLPVRWA